MRIIPIYHTPANQYKLSYGQTNNPLFAGNFAHKEAKGDYGFQELDVFDRHLVASVPLKPGEIIYRGFTDKTKKFGQSFLIKFNLRNGMVYFLVDSDSEEIVFEKKGCQLQYINFIWHQGAAICSADVEPSLLPYKLNQL